MKEINLIIYIWQKNVTLLYVDNMQPVERKRVVKMLLGCLDKIRKERKSQVELKNKRPICKLFSFVLLPTLSGLFLSFRLSNWCLR